MCRLAFILLRIWKNVCMGHNFSESLFLHFLIFCRLILCKKFIHFLSLESHILNYCMCVCAYHNTISRNQSNAWIIFIRFLFKCEGKLVSLEPYNNIDIHIICLVVVVAVVFIMLFILFHHYSKHCIWRCWNWCDYCALISISITYHVVIHIELDKNEMARLECI